MEEPSHGYDRAVLHRDPNDELSRLGWSEPVARAVKEAGLLLLRVILRLEGEQVGHERFDPLNYRLIQQACGERPVTGDLLVDLDALLAH